MKTLWNQWNSLIIETRLKYIAGTIAIIQLILISVSFILVSGIPWSGICHSIFWTIAYFIMRSFEKTAKKYTDD
jgi:hypothetical protein